MQAYIVWLTAYSPEIILIEFHFVFYFGAIQELAQVQVQVALRSVGLFGSSSDSDSSESGTENDDQDENDVIEIPSAELGQVLMSSGFNWFSVVETDRHNQVIP